METITLKALASELGMDRSHLRKFVLGLGFEPFRVRTPDSGNQATLAVTFEQADEIRRRRANAGFTLGRTYAQVRPSSVGLFYLVLLDPEARPNRIKFGFTGSINERMSDYSTSNPDAELLDSFDCLRTWETTAIAAITNLDTCQYVSGEVYDCADIDAVRARASGFFAMLPHPTLDGSNP